MQLHAQGAGQRRAFDFDDYLMLLYGHAGIGIQLFPDEFFNEPHFRRFIKIPFHQQISNLISH